MKLRPRFDRLCDICKKPFRTWLRNGWLCKDCRKKRNSTKGRKYGTSTIQRIENKLKEAQKDV